MKNIKRNMLFVLLITLLLFPFISVNAVTVVDCGNVTAIPKKIPEITSFLITIVQVAVPVILVIVSSIDLFKGITAQKEDEIKKGRQLLLKRVIVAFLIFFVVAIVKFVVSIAADNSSKDNIMSCIDCFLSESCNNERNK